MRRLLREAYVALAVAEKDIKVYYAKPSTVMFGFLLPVSLFLSYVVGRGVTVDEAIPVLIAQTLLFASSSIGPVTIPMERRVKTFDRFLVAPVSLQAILVGKTLAGLAYGTVASIPPIAVGLAVGMSVRSPLELALGIALSSLTFSCMGVMFASIPTQNPGQVMMPLNFVRIPMLFVSGVFIPVSRLPAWGRALAALSPLTYSMDLVRAGIQGARHFGLLTSTLGLLFYFILFLTVAMRFHLVIQKRE
mgnify:CR=1 FL=1